MVPTDRRVPVGGLRQRCGPVKPYLRIPPVSRQTGHLAHLDEHTPLKLVSSYILATIWSSAGPG